MEFEQLRISGCTSIRPTLFQDKRGNFFKTFIEEEFKRAGLMTNFVEEYFSMSYKGVIRGLHFQTPPYECYKIINCLYGNIVDVILDLRVGSPTYNNYEVIYLGADCSNLIYLPPGIAHGYLVKSEIAIIAYKVTNKYSALHDLGIKWNSLSFDWGIEAPIISSRDDKFPLLSEFHSPFKYRA